MNFSFVCLAVGAYRTQGARRNCVVTMNRQIMPTNCSWRLLLSLLHLCLPTSIKRDIY